MVNNDPLFSLLIVLPSQRFISPPFPHAMLKVSYVIRCILCSDAFVAFSFHFRKQPASRGTSTAYLSLHATTNNPCSLEPVLKGWQDLEAPAIWVLTLVVIPAHPRCSRYNTAQALPPPKIEMPPKMPQSHLDIIRIVHTRSDAKQNHSSAVGSQYHSDIPG